jgi:hypothetical protein
MSELRQFQENRERLEAVRGLIAAMPKAGRKIESSPAEEGFNPEKRAGAATTRGRRGSPPTRR